MSEALKIAAEAPGYIETFLVEMLEGEHPDNEVLLGTLLCGDESIQDLLKITRNTADFLDEG